MNENELHLWLELLSQMTEEEKAQFIVSSDKTNFHSYLLSIFVPVSIIRVQNY